MDVKSYVSDPKSEKNFLETIIKSLREYIDSEEPLGENSVNKITSTQLQKICFFTTRHLEVPATTSWYIFGGYCHNHVVHRNTLESIVDFELDKDCNSFIGDIDSVMLDYIKKSKIFRLNHLDYMKQMYKKHTPQEYKNLYITHYPYINCIREFRGYIKDYLENPLNFTYRDLCRDFCEYKDNFHKIFFNMTEFSDFHDIIYEYNFFLEQIAYKLQFITENNESFPEEKEDDIKKFLKDMRDYYTNNVWGSIALVISAKTVEGISAGRIHEENINRKNKNRHQLPDMLYEFRSKSDYFNLLPTSIEIKKYFGMEAYDKPLSIIQDIYTRK